MKNKRSYPFAIVTQKAANSLNVGSPWVYAEEITSTSREFENGEIVDVLSSKERYLGTGLVSLNSKIRIRILSKNANDTFDDAFWERRIRYAWEYRKNVMREEDLKCCRIIFGEADQMPGLTVDRYNDVLVIQTASYGMDIRKNIIFPLIVKVLRNDGEKISGIFERNDLGLRDKEGLKQFKGWFDLDGEQHPQSTITQIVENGITYEVDFENGQKTGFFLDQKFNRLSAASIAKGKRVLDCFTHTGSFGLNVAKGGAERVTSVDVSEDALTTAKKNAELSGLSDKIDYVCADVFELLTDLLKKGGSPYDYIILDPPAFAKSRAVKDNALRGYKDINYRAMRLLPRGGYLASASCSHFVTSEMFLKMLKSAADDAGRQLRIIEMRAQSPDHPILLGADEGNYLKYFLMQVI